MRGRQANLSFAASYYSVPDGTLTAMIVSWGGTDIPYA
jgi:hypothetical protein